MQPIPRSKLVWINLPAGATAGAAPKFPNIPELVGKTIIGIEFYDITILSATPDQTQVISAADSLGVTLVLKEDSLQRIEQIPVATLLPTNNAGIWKEFTPFIVNWQSSFVQLNATPGVSSTAVPFNVFYVD